VDVAKRKAHQTVVDPQPLEQTQQDEANFNHVSSENASTTVYHTSNQDAHINALQGEWRIGDHLWQHLSPALQEAIRKIRNDHLP
jgi:hypothetical protein